MAAAVITCWLALGGLAEVRADDPSDGGRWSWGPGAATLRQTTLWRELPIRGPLVQLELLNRDCLSGELRRLTDESIEFRTISGSTVQFPRAALLGLQQSAEWDVLEFRRGSCGTSTSPCEFAATPREGRLSGWLQLGAESVDELCSISLGQWSFRVRSNVRRITSVDRRLPQRLTLDWRGGRVRLFLAGQLICEDRAPFDADPVVVTPGDGVDFQDAILARPRNHPVTKSHPLALPLVGLADGEELAAEHVQIVDGELELESDGAATRWPWSEWKSIAWPAPRDNIPAHPVSGWLVELELQPLAESPGETLDRLTGAITRADGTGLWLAHPLLGRLPIAWSAVRRITLRGWGTATPLRLGPVHLGDEIRLDLRSPTPIGHRLAGHFPAPKFWNGRLWIELDHSELEPAGAETPPGSPFLAELRAGGLLTDLSINQQPLAPLNSRIRWKADVARPERLTIPLPRSLLQRRDNSWELREHPRNAAGGYDDWELWNLILYETWP
ncbi:hypothetical protein [Planctellipticum variicoloris]|uniref:hypothetical protein n=1 Tax=Planctellipticum variicoloris TaxID=3064265 RepID=UPI003013DD2E|nr:hypothetical protein SH412_003293 [Planctomycetaceae bacterium SH412]